MEKERDGRDDGKENDFHGIISLWTLLSSFLFLEVPSVDGSPQRSLPREKKSFVQQTIAMKTFLLQWMK